MVHFETFNKRPKKKKHLYQQEVPQRRFFFFYSILRWSVAVSTMRRQSSRTAAFLQVDARPTFCWPRSASTARSQVWLGLPNGRFRSGGSLRIPAATARWWSSCGELRAICPKSRKRLSLTRRERRFSVQKSGMLFCRVPAQFKHWMQVYRKCPELYLYISILYKFKTYLLTLLITIWRVVFIYQRVHVCRVVQLRPSPGIRRSYRLDGDVAMAIAAERSRNMSGYSCEPDNMDKDIEIIYRERTAVWYVWYIKCFFMRDHTGSA